MTVQKQLFTSNSEHWGTPQEVLDLLYKLGPIDLDPCANETSLVEARTSFYLPKQDGLAESWLPYERRYVNPPFGRSLAKWAEKVRRESFFGETTVLTPARTDTKWCHLLWYEADAVCFWRGRMKFVDPATGQPSKNAAPFPTMLTYFGDRVEDFRYLFAPKGRVLTL